MKLKEFVRLNHNLWNRIPSEIRKLPSLNILKLHFMGKIFLIHHDPL